MPDLDERFHALDRVGPPDLWPDVQHREPRPMRESPPSRRFLAAAVAFAVASAGIALGVRAFRGAESAPAAAVGNGKIAFVGDDETGIYVVNPDGTGRAKLTDGFGPAWSPDGNRIAFLRGISEGNLQLYVMNVDGTALTLIVADWRGNNLSWSPDGTRFAYYCACDGAIHVMNVDGTDDYRLTESNAARDPAWSPDGTKIAFRQPVNGDFEIFVINVDGSVLTRLTNDPAHDLGPAWSPDGTRIAFSRSSERPGGIHEDIYVMNADGSEVARLTEDPAWDSSPVWSPDGTKIAFASSREGGTWQIYVMNADGSEQGQLTYLSNGAMAPDWQPILGEEGPTPTATPSASPSELTLHVAATIPVTDLDVGVVGDIAIGEQGGVWATVVGQQDPFSTSFVVRLDPQTNEVTASIPIEGDPAGIAATPDAVWVTVNETPDAVLRIDPAANAVVATVPLGEDHFAGPVAADASAVWVVDGLFEGEQPILSLVRIDPVTNEVLARIPLPESSDFDDIAVGEGAVWLTQVNGGNVIKVDPATNQAVATIPAGVVSNRFDGLVVGEGSVWVDALRPDVAQKDWPQETALAIRIDPISGQIQGDPISLEGGLPSPLGAYSAPMGVGEGGVWLFGYDANLDHMMVARLNLDSLEVDTSIVIEDQGVSESAAFDGENRAIWIAYHESIVRVDLY